MKLFRKLSAAAAAVSLAITVGTEVFADDLLYVYDDYWGLYLATDDNGNMYYYREDTGEEFNCYIDDDGSLIYYNDTVSGKITQTQEYIDPEEITKEDSAKDGIRIQSHTQQEITQKFFELGLDKDWKTEYSVNPSVKKPYSEGKLTKESLQQGLDMLNFIRYTAGLPDNVVLDDRYNHYAQCAGVVNAANGALSHYPSKPSGMNDDLFNDGYKGAGKSNLGMGYSDLPSSLVYGYMQDSDKSNIDRVGHRRWLINPSLRKVGFGFAGNYTATYVIEDDFDFGKSFAGDYVAWPPENMPMELYRSTSGRYAFSVNVGNDYDKNSLYDAVIKVTSKKTGKSWTISKNSGGDTYFTVNNQNYGLSGCIIFDTGVMFESGDTVSVNISGIKKNSGESASISYKVNFFTIRPSIEDCDISAIKPQVYTGKAIKPKLTVKYNGVKLTEGVDYTLDYRNNKAMGSGSIIITGKGKYSGTDYAYFSIKPKKHTITKLTAGYQSFTVNWKKVSGADKYFIQYSTSASMKNAKTVYADWFDTSKTVNGLKSGKKYYVRICTEVYDYSDPRGYNTGAWSKVKAVTVK